MSDPPPAKKKSLKTKLKNLFSSKQTRSSTSKPTPVPVTTQQTPLFQPAEEETVWPPERLAEMKRSYREQAARMQAEHDAEERRRKEEARRREEKRKLRKTADMYDRIHGAPSMGVGKGRDGVEEGVIGESKVHIRNGRIVRGCVTDGDGERGIGCTGGDEETENRVRPMKSLHDAENYSKYERETGLVDPHILRWD